MAQFGKNKIKGKKNQPGLLSSNLLPQAQDQGVLSAAPSQAFRLSAAV